jgi:hypothetical protein
MNDHPSHRLRRLSDYESDRWLPFAYVAYLLTMGAVIWGLTIIVWSFLHG